MVLEKVDNIPARSGKIDETDTFSKNRTIQEVAYEGVKAEAAPKIAVAEPDEFSAVPSVQEQAKAQQQVFHGEPPLSPPAFYPRKTKVAFSPRTLVAVAGMLSLVVVQKFLKFPTEEFKIKAKEEETNFLVKARLICGYIELGGWVVATENCVDLNENLNQYQKILNENKPPKLEAFMVGQVVAILDEIPHQVLIEIFPKKRFLYKTENTFITPFVSFKEVDGPLYESPRFYGNILNIVDFLKILKLKRSSSSK